MEKLLLAIFITFSLNVFIGLSTSSSKQLLAQGVNPPLYLAAILGDRLH